MNTTIFTSDLIYAPDMDDRQALLDWLSHHHQPKIARHKFDELQTHVLRQIVKLELRLLATVATDDHSQN